MEFSSNGKGNLGVTLGAIGTGLGVFNGGLGNVLGGITNNGTANEILDIKTENAILKSELNTERKISTLEAQVNANAAAQAVINCGLNSSTAVLQNQMSQLMEMTKMYIPSTSVATVTATSTTVTG